MAYVIARPIEGISINGNEYVLNEHGDVVRWVTEKQARLFLEAQGISDDDMERYGIQILDVQDEFPEENLINGKRYEEVAGEAKVFYWADEMFCYYNDDILLTDDDGNPKVISCHSALYGPCTAYCDNGVIVAVETDYTHVPVVNE